MAKNTAFLVLILVVCVSTSLAAQPQPSSLASSALQDESSALPDEDGQRRTVRAVPLQPDERIALDGRLDVEAWSRAVPARDFIQQDPDNGRPAVEPTEVLFTGGPRVRASDGRTAAILLDGLSRSETLRVLVEEIEQSDVIVYLEIQWNLRRGLAGSLTWVAGTKSFRYVRISLSPHLTGDVMVATLGHELQHAVEIARERSIISSATLASYYAKSGWRMTAHWNGWDTLAARRAGDEVRRELAGYGVASKDTLRSSGSL